MTEIDRIRNQQPGETGATDVTVSVVTLISIWFTFLSGLTCVFCCEQAKRLPEILSLIIGNMQASRMDGKLDQELKGILRELEHMTLSNPTPADLRTNKRSGVRTKDRPTRDIGFKSAAVRLSRA